MSGLLLCGVDEAGRGPLAGAVFAAAVILDPAHPIAGLADSKKLSEARRDALAIEIRQHALAWSIATASVAEPVESDVNPAVLRDSTSPPTPTRRHSRASAAQKREYMPYFTSPMRRTMSCSFGSLRNLS